MKVGTPGLIISAVLFSLLALIFVLPFIYAPGTFIDLGGTSGILDHDWTIGQFIYALGDILCHQETDRSFIINGSQMAMCTRDMGLITGSAVTLFLTFNYVNEYSFVERKIVYFGLLLLLIAILEWIAGTMIGYDLAYLRFLSGTIGGAGIALIIQNIASEIWKGEGVS